MTVVRVTNGYSPAAWRRLWRRCPEARRGGWPWRRRLLGLGCRLCLCLPLSDYQEAVVRQVAAASRGEGDPVPYHSFTTGPRAVGHALASLIHWANGDDAECSFALEDIGSALEETVYPYSNEGVRARAAVQDVVAGPHGPPRLACKCVARRAARACRRCAGRGVPPLAGRSAQAAAILKDCWQDARTLAVLADCLEDGGCDDGHLLGHLRVYHREGDGPLWGCWALEACAAQGAR